MSEPTGLRFEVWQATSSGGWMLTRRRVFRGLRRAQACAWWIRHTYPRDSVFRKTDIRTTWHLQPVGSPSMPDLEGLTTAVNNLIDSEHTAATELQKLSDLVKSLSVGNVTQDQIDAITTAVTQVATNLNSDVADADAGQDKPPTGAMDPIETEAVDAPSVAASTGKRSRNP